MGLLASASEVKYKLPIKSNEVIKNAMTAIFLRVETPNLFVNPDSTVMSVLLSGARDRTRKNLVAFAGNDFSLT